MMRIRQHSHAIVLIMLLALLLAGCGTAKSKEFTQYKGTDGLIITFADNAPPDAVYEARPFPLKFRIKDAGAFDVNYTKMIITFSYDPLYISSPVGIYNPERYDAEQRFIHGKSANHPTGEDRLFSIPADQSFEAKQVYGQREQPETEILASVCYAYTTYLSTGVCIDTNMYDENMRKQACEAKDLAFTGGQGAPITIDRIEVAMLPVVSRDRSMESIRPQFIIHIKDVGKGYIVGPDTLPMSTACLLKGINKTELNSVLINARLHNTKLECGPDDAGTIKLFNGEGEISCTIPESELTNPSFSVKQNYMSTLTINVTYLYKTSTSTKVTIKRTGNSDDEIPGFGGKAVGYLYTGDTLYLDEAGRPVTLCTHYAKNPAAAPDVLKGRIDEDFSCSCGNERCLKLSKDGKCIFGNICPTNTYCCNDQKATAATSGYLMEAVVADPDVQIPKTGASPSYQEINMLLDALSQKYGIPKDILQAMAYKESTWTCSKSGDAGKAYGLLQINVNYHPKYEIQTGKNECSYNAEYGATYLVSLYKQYGDWPSAIMHYNGSNERAAAYRDSVLKLMQEKPWLQWL